MEHQFRYLFTPIKVGATEIRNRVALTAHGTLFSERSLPTEQLGYYYAERAKGGVGLIISEVMAVHSTARLGSKVIAIYDPTVVEPLRRVATMIQDHGARFFGQLWHPGAQNPSRSAVAPSPIAASIYRTIARELDRKTIQSIVEGYAISARHLVEAGMDGVEVHGGHGYLLSQFLSPRFNKRTDEYGGSLDNRLRFVLEVLQAIRRTVGDKFTVGIRLSGDELVDGGLRVPDMIEVCSRLEATGLIDFLNLSVGAYPRVDLTIASMAMPLGYQLYSTATIKEAVNLPVLAAGRINDPVMADQILADGQADLVAMTRAHIADPWLLTKAREGRLEDIRLCVACNQGCVGHNFLGVPITCIQNPGVGRERELGAGTLKMADAPKRAVVVGGGPAGMTAARVLAERGHSVTLFEQQSALGGQVSMAARTEGWNELGGVTRWLEMQIAKLPIDLRLGHRAVADDVLALQPDVVVVATGSVPPPLEAPGDGSVRLCSTWGAFELGDEDGGRVLVIDELGYPQAVNVAEYLARLGKIVTIATRWPYVGVEMTNSMELPLVYRRLGKLGVAMIPFVELTDVRQRTATLSHVYGGKTERVEDLDVIVLVDWNRPERGLCDELKGRVAALHAVGDCYSVRTIQMAIEQAELVARTL